ncbi:MAG: hypothetical protein O3A46_11065, partial [Candidatus Poribacteria bacterium]|nr:hypothetical protein [Candidatus Poribacteria bacterium]
MARTLLTLGLAGLILFGAARAEAAFESVLEIVPADAHAVIYVKSLWELSNDLDALMTLATGEPSKEVLAKTLAGIVGAGFSSDEELSRIGFDLEKDFALAFLDPTFDRFTAIIHVKDDARVRNVLKRESGSPNKNYGGVAYSALGDHESGIVGDVLVFTKTKGGLPRFVDTANKTAPSFGVSPELKRLNLSFGKTGDDVGVYIDSETMKESLIEFLSRESAPAPLRMLALPRVPFVKR